MIKEEPLKKRITVEIEIFHRNFPMVNWKFLVRNLALR